MKRQLWLVGAGVVLAITLLFVFPKGAQEKTIETGSLPAATSTAAAVQKVAPPARVKSISEILTVSPVDLMIAELIDCESDGRSIRIIDTNGKYSYGILQYQKSTWDGWSRESGIKGDPMVPEDAIRMARWAIAQGDTYLGQWSCAHILALLD